MSKRILIVEDNNSDLELLLLVLQVASPAVEIHVARDGQEALDLLLPTGSRTGNSGLPYALILLDIKMPKVDGFEVLSRLKSDPATRTLPVIMFTSSDHERDVDQAYQLGANGYVVKPVDFEQYQNLIDSIVAFWLSVNHPASPTSSRTEDPARREEVRLADCRTRGS